jgi:aspartyl-tRNA(Asn)/glutamyl-tRNA(Gln) amidotransferase subunit A
MARLFERVDVIITPTIARATPTVCARGRRTGSLDSEQPLALAPVPLAGLAGIPALTIPCGMAEGMPVSVQMMARAWHEQTLANVGAVFERDRSAELRRPRILRGGTIDQLL